jgi:hypothetical protein
MTYTATMRIIDTEKALALLEMEAKPENAMHRKKKRKILVKPTQEY